MRSALQLLGGVAVAGAVAAGSTAFTAAGVTNSIGGASFIGGSVSQSVTGANVSAIAFLYGNAGANTIVRTVTLTFADAEANGKQVTLTEGSSGGSWSGDATAFTCGGTSATFTAAPIASVTSVCTAVTNASAGLAAVGAGYLGLTNLTITVA